MVCDITNMRQISPHILMMVNLMTDYDPLSLVPHGLLVTRAWLTASGANRHTIDNWIKSQRLVSVMPGVLKRPDTELTWQGVVCSFQRMDRHWLTVGGLTALTLQGMGHYLSADEEKTIHLYGQAKLPPWINRLVPGTVFIRHPYINTTPKWRATISELHLRLWKRLYWPYGFDKLQIDVSSPELAFFEILADVPNDISFEHADQLLQGLTSLSPKILNGLLEYCDNVKVKRLFLWLSERNQMPWLKRLELQKFSVDSGALGSGKRVIASGGKLDRKYLITVPQEMVGQADG